MINIIRDNIKNLLTLVKSNISFNNENKEDKCLLLVTLLVTATSLNKRLI